MRKVYQPPSSGGRWYSVALTAILVTLAVFLVLPLTQMLSSHVQQQKYSGTIDSAPPPPPPSMDTPPPEPPPEEEPEEEPPPQLSDAPKPLNLNINLDVALGSGGALASLTASDFASAAQDLAGLAVDMSELDNKPVLLASVPPQYPPELRKAKIEGTVTLLFLLNEDGRVEDPRVEQSSRQEFEKPALEAVKKWRFKPGLKEGAAVRTFMRLPMQFKIST